MIARIPLDNLLKIYGILEIDLSYFLKESDYIKSLNSKFPIIQNNSNHYKPSSMLKETHEDESEDLISAVNIGKENVYSII